MSIEPGVVDANILVYSMDADMPQHPASRSLLETASQTPSVLCVTSQILCEFYSIVTNRRRVPSPRSATDALSAIAELLSFLRVLPIPSRAVAEWMDLLKRHPVTGANIFDLQIVAALRANGINRIYTFNRNDFEVLPSSCLELL